MRRNLVGRLNHPLHRRYHRPGDLMISLTLEQAFATVHILAASSALPVGVAVLLLPKGTHTHRVVGTIYVLVLVLVNAAALSLHREDAFGVFHVLAVISL